MRVKMAAAIIGLPGGQKERGFPCLTYLLSPQLRTQNSRLHVCQKVSNAVNICFFFFQIHIIILQRICQTVYLCLAWRVTCKYILLKIIFLVKRVGCYLKLWFIFHLHFNTDIFLRVIWYSCVLRFCQESKVSGPKLCIFLAGIKPCPTKVFFTTYVTMGGGGS